MRIPDSGGSIARDSQHFRAVRGEDCAPNSPGVAAQDRSRFTIASVPHSRRPILGDRHDQRRDRVAGNRQNGPFVPHEANRQRVEP